MKTIIINKETKNYKIKKLFLVFAITCSVILYIFNRPEDKSKIYSGTWQMQDANHQNTVVKLSNSEIKIGKKVKYFKYHGFGTSVGGKAARNITLNTKDIINNPDKYMYQTILLGKGEMPYYTFILKNSKKMYTIIFPSKDKNKAIMIDSKSKNYPLQGTVLYALNRKTAPDYDDYVNKYIKKDIKD